jgi:hypothetical protein
MKNFVIFYAQDLLNINIILFALGYTCILYFHSFAQWEGKVKWFIFYLVNECKCFDLCMIDFR